MKLPTQEELAERWATLATEAVRSLELRTQCSMGDHYDRLIESIVELQRMAFETGVLSRLVERIS